MENINLGHFHEVMDRLHVLQSTVEDHIIKHPLMEHYPKILGKVDAAQALLSAAYREVVEMEAEYVESESR